jgi:hypothetical protein
MTHRFAEKFKAQISQFTFAFLAYYQREHARKHHLLLGISSLNRKSSSLTTLRNVGEIRFGTRSRIGVKYISYAMLHRGGDLNAGELALRPQSKSEFTRFDRA